MGNAGFKLGTDLLDKSASQSLSPPPDELRDGATLFLDFDGTLAAFDDDPEAVFLSDERQQQLSALHRRLEGRLVVISGRSLSSLEMRIADPAIALIGSHGLEWRVGDERGGPDEDQPALRAASAKIAELARRSDVRFEDKSFGAALHFRETPEKQALLEEEATSIAARYGLAIQHGHHVIELRLEGGHKGDALAEFMQRAPFKAGNPVMVGDDLTDEDGFARARALGGEGVLVGEPRETSATYRLADVDAVWEWLA